MKVSVLLFLGVVLMAAFTSVEGWRRRRFRIRVRGRRIVRALCSPVCSTSCTYACPKCAPVCGYGCKRVCRGKREANLVNSDGSYTKPMPCDFETYDVNNDSVISRAELGNQNGKTGEEEDVKQLFTLMDLDGDGGVSHDEFEVAPLDKDCGQGKTVDGGDAENDEGIISDLEDLDDVDEEDDDQKHKNIII